MTNRIERDSLGDVAIPAERLWGAVTERSRSHFRIGDEASMPREVIHALAQVKHAAARANAELGVLSGDEAALIGRVAEEIASGALDGEFPLVVWQTGSGTHTNMNVNEVIANRARQLAAQPALHPNDHVNRSQSSNDTFPTAMHVAAATTLRAVTLPGAERLRAALSARANEYAAVIKLGRTHLMDATPLTLGQELGAFVTQLDEALRQLRSALEQLSPVALGGTAVGTGLNAPQGFDAAAVRHLAALTGIPFTPARDKFAALAGHDALVEVHGALKRLAVVALKLANDVRLLGSGPRGGLAELELPANEPGSSIMPGKTNPTQCEALSMVCARVLGNDVTVSVAGASGHLQLNAFKPVIVSCVLESARLLGDACRSFAEHCVDGLRADPAVIARHLERSLMLVTALTPTLGYARAAEIAKKAHAERSTLREAALALGYVTAEQFDAWVSPAAMLGPR